MYVEFNQLSETSKLWIYIAERSLSEQELADLNERSRQFCNAWTSHKSDLFASYIIPYSNVLILSADEEKHQASGCSIDESVRWIRSLEKDFHISWMSRFVVTYIMNQNVQIAELSNFLETYSESERESILVVNPNCKIKEDLSSLFLVPFPRSVYASVNPEILNHSFKL